MESYLTFLLIFSFERLSLPAGGELRANHELHLVEDHEREQEVVVERAKNSKHHGRTDRETLLRTAEESGDAVRFVKACQFAAEPDGNLDNAE